MSTYENNLIPIKKLYTSISKWVDEETCNTCFKTICDEYDSNCKKDLKKNHWENSQVRKLLQVHERLLLTDTMNEDIKNDFSRRYMYPRVITYLRLTCFDQLGQPANWITFNNWLISKKKRAEREKIVNEIQIDNKIKFTEKLYEKYLEIYGVKNSFFNFISNVISVQTREELLMHIEIRTSNETSPTLAEREVTERDKAEYLFKIRNDFTHNTYSQGPVKGLPKKNESEWDFRETFYKGKERFSISTHKNFEEKLKEIVLIGIAEIIKKKSNAECT